MVVKIIFLDCNSNKLLKGLMKLEELSIVWVKSLSEALAEEMEYLKPIKDFANIISDTMTIVYRS